jgi:hypothetical protein
MPSQVARTYWEPLVAPFARALVLVAVAGVVAVAVYVRGCVSLVIGSVAVVVGDGRVVAWLVGWSLLCCCLV